MKKKVFFSLCLLISSYAFCQGWTEAQLDSADTAKDIDQLDEKEKDAILYINLARLYPQPFLKNEVEPYFGTSRTGDNLRNSTYKKSLVKDLKDRQPVKALRFDETMYGLAKCFATESGKSGAVSHKRKGCSYGYYGECCSYGMEAGKDIALQWLIDDKTPGVGHRVICLSADYSVVGIATGRHKTYSFCAVADFK